MTRLRTRIARLTLALTGCAVVWSCNAPFIPVPPPGQTTTFSSELVTDGQGGQKTVWVAHGPAYMAASFARVNVFDSTRSAGVITVAMSDGSYTSQPFDGTMGDRVEISFYEPQSGMVTAGVCFQLTEQTVTTPTGPSAPRCPSP
jgi:hypothetical protein